MQASDLKAFQQFLRVLGSDACLLWLLPSAQIDCVDPGAAQSIGAIRTVRTELSLNFPTLELDVVNEKAFEFVARVMEKACRKQEVELLNPDYEFVLSKGVIHVGRYHEVNIPHELPIPISITQEQRKKLRIGRYGLLQTLAWNSESDFAPLNPDSLEIEPVCVGINFRVSSSNTVARYISFAEINRTSFLPWA